MGYFLMVVILIVCVMLGVVILVQNPKGGGLATGFQGASQMGGVQKTTDFLVKSNRPRAGPGRVDRRRRDE